MLAGNKVRSCSIAYRRKATLCPEVPYLTTSTPPPPHFLRKPHSAAESSPGKERLKYFGQPVQLFHLYVVWCLNLAVFGKVKTNLRDVKLPKRFLTEKRDQENRRRGSCSDCLQCWYVKCDRVRCISLPLPSPISSMQE